MVALQGFADPNRIRGAIDIARELIPFRSTRGSQDERRVATHLCSILRTRFGAIPEYHPVPGEEGGNVWLPFGTPRIVLSTHLDVVPAPDELFDPRWEDGKLYGRGACDAKGIIGAMVEVAALLRAQGKTDFGLLFVTGEEVNGSGAKHAAELLSNVGIRYVINGEPTQGKIVTGHKGVLNVTLGFEGKAAHSGYPERGVDANRKLIDVLARIYALSDRGVFGVDPELGLTTFSAGVLRSTNGGAHTICAHAEAKCMFRTTVSNDDVLETLHREIPEIESIVIGNTLPPVHMLPIEGFGHETVAFATDIPHYQKLAGVECVLFGPGSIWDAHTDHEWIGWQEMGRGINGYLKIHQALERRLSVET
jgi:acetylornithine deacetylase